MSDFKAEGKPTAWGWIESSKSKVEQYVIEFAVARTDDQGAPRVDSIVKTQTVTTDEQMGYVLQDLRTCGWDGADPDNIELDVNRTVRLVITTDEHGDKVKSIYPLEGGGLGKYLLSKQAMPEDRKRAVTDRLRAAMAASGTTTATKPTTPRARPAASNGGNNNRDEIPPDSFGGGDDIPF